MTNMSAGNVTCPKRAVLNLPNSRVVIGHYIFPWLLIIGVTGNILNLIVLNGKGMRTKTNALLSAMAVADLCFLILMLPTELQVFENVASRNWYRSFLAHHKMTLIFSSNWFATSSTWMAIAVTAERVFAIKMPLHAKFYWTNSRVALLIITVFVCNMLVHLYNLFWFRVITYSFYCTDGSLAFSAYRLVPLNSTDPSFLYVQASRIFVPHVSITLPYFILLILNAFLVYYLHENRRSIASAATNAPQLRQNELKVALTVAVIVLTFTLCSAPSVALYLYDAVVTFALHSSPYTVTFFNLSILSNYLVVLGKTSNFLLYCGASHNFRRRLVRLFMRTRNNRPTGSSSRGSTSTRRTTLTSIFAAAIAEFQFNHRSDQQRSSVDACCAIAGDARRSRQHGSGELIDMKTIPSKKIVPFQKDKENEKRRHSTQHQGCPIGILCRLNEDTQSLLENHLYSNG